MTLRDDDDDDGTLHPRRRVMNSCLCECPRKGGLREQESTFFKRWKKIGYPRQSSRMLSFCERM